MERLDHPRIVPIIDVGEDKSGGFLVNGMGLQYIAMEYVDGCALDRLLVSEELLDEDLIVEVMCRVAEGLQHAHSKGVIHRDVKPSNFLVSRQGQILITDFGIAWATGEAAITKDGERPGSPHYISPEQAAGRSAAIDARSDIYSLGIVLYQMITGRVPFDGDTPAPTILIKHRSELPLPPTEVRADVPEDLARVAMKCLEKDPDARYQTAQALIDDLPARPSAASKLARLVEKTVSQKNVTDTNVRGSAANGRQRSGGRSK
jgi:serine/threonine-protein kinase